MVVVLSITTIAKGKKIKVKNSNNNNNNSNNNENQHLILGIHSGRPFPRVPLRQSW